MRTVRDSTHYLINKQLLLISSTGWFNVEGEGEEILTTSGCVAASVGVVISVGVPITLFLHWGQVQDAHRLL